MDSRKIKVGVVEDEFIIAEDLKCILKNLDYEVIFNVPSARESKAAMEKELPDILLLDIKLKGEEDGISIAEYIRKNYTTPFIFITANADAQTIKRARNVKPNGYLVKPFQLPDVHAAIEIALSCMDEKNLSSSKPLNILKEVLFVRDRNLMLKVKFDEIIYIEADGNHSILFTSNRKFLISKTLKEVSENLDSERFIRLHKSYIVNTEFITAIGADEVHLNGIQLPIGRAYLQNLHTFFHQID